MISEGHAFVGRISPKKLDFRASIPTIYRLINRVLCHAAQMVLRGALEGGAVDVPANIARIIRTVRKRLNLTQQEFATQLRVALPTVSRWENGVHIPSRLALDRVELYLQGLGKDGKQLLVEFFHNGRGRG